MTLLYYPAYINLCKKSCIVVGGGKVAERKALALIRSGATVKIISPDITNALEKEKQKGTIKHVQRKYRKGDLKSAFLVVAATSDGGINRQVFEESDCLINVVDCPDMANFIVPSVVERGPLKIAISTSGASPAIAKAIRKEIEGFYGREFGHFLIFVKQLRKRAANEIPDEKIRERFLKEIASKRIFDTLRNDGLKETKKALLQKLQSIKD